MDDEPIISPRIMMDIIERVEIAITDRYGDTDSYDSDAERYIKRWQKWADDGEYCNFHMITKHNNKFNLTATLDNMDEDLVLQIAVDLSVEVPGLIYAVSEIKELLPESYKDASIAFRNASKKVYVEPAEAISTAYAALESIIKKICEDDSIENCDPKGKLHILVSHILKQFKFFPDKNLNENIRNIGSGFVTITQAISYIRSNHTKVHGKLEKEIIADPIYAMLVINSVATFSLFLLNYYAKHYNPELFKKPEPVEQDQGAGLEDDEIPF